MFRFLLSLSVIFVLTSSAHGGSNANAIITLDLVANGGTGNQIDDGVVSGVVSGQGTKIVVEVFAKGVVTSLVGIAVEFDFDTSVLMLDIDTVNISPFPFFIFLETGKGVAFADAQPLTLAGSGYIGRVEFSTLIDVTGKEFSLGIKSVQLAESPETQDFLESASRIWFNRDKQITAADADFDGSGVVDIQDFLPFVAAFGSQQGQSAYDAKYDLDGSGTVDIADFLAFVDVYGQTVQTVPIDSVETDRAALVALYNATDGENWTDNTNWLSDKPLGEWHGVRTDDATGRVVLLSLYDNQMSGPIPSELGNLTDLQKLALPDNQLSGPIPSELGNLAKLEDLRLYRTQLTGTIPASLSNLSNLTRLSLSENQLTGTIPPELGNLANLTRLHLGRNQLSGPIPSSLGNLSNLTNLYLQGNQLSGPIPAELGSLSNLTFGNLQSNQLSGPIPAELGNLSNLTSLILSGNPHLCMPISLIDWKFYETNGVSKCSE